jgi:hypothetical protein
MIVFLLIGMAHAVMISKGASIYHGARMARSTGHSSYFFYWRAFL